MKKISQKHKNWLDRRSKKIAKKKKKSYKAYSPIYKEKTNHKHKINVEPFMAPNNFSFINNPDDTINFFNGIFSLISKRSTQQKNIHIDLSQTNKLTIDALMFLLAIINNLNSVLKKRINFFGNEPIDNITNKLFKESGFYGYVKKINNDPISRSEDNLQIVSGRDCDVYLAQRVSDFIVKKSNLSLKKLRFIYVIMIELMSNTHKHAYAENNKVLNSRWFCYVKYINKDTVAFSFLDTGLGIPTTIKKKFWEKISLLGINTDNEFMKSVLDGEFRTATSEGYRGKGLPKIRKYSKEKKILNLHIISNKADILVDSDKYIQKNIKNKLNGTLYYWEVKPSQL